MIRVGDRLKLERKRKNLTLEEVAKATKIRASFLDAIEKGEYKKLPSSAYIQGFIKNYAEFLGLPTKEILAIFRREFDEREFLGVLPESFTQTKQPLSGFRLGQTSIIIGLGLIFILGFVLFQYRSAFLDPALSLTTPKDNAVISTPTVTVSGKAEVNTTVTINDVPVFLDKDGNFTKDITVFTGGNTIIVKESNNFGRKTTLLRHVTVQ